MIGEVEEHGVGISILIEITNLLDDSTEKMSYDFPKVLPPRHTINHCIELESRLHPPKYILIDYPRLSWNN
jgi:hypothetical protein